MESGLRDSYKKKPENVPDVLHREIKEVTNVFFVSPLEVTEKVGETDKITREGGITDKDNRYDVSFYTKTLYYPDSWRTVEFFVKYFALMLSKVNMVSSVTHNHLNTIFVFSDYKRNVRVAGDIPDILLSNIEQIIFIDIHSDGWRVTVAILDRSSPHVDRTAIDTVIFEFAYGKNEDYHADRLFDEWGLKGNNKTQRRQTKNYAQAQLFEPGEERLGVDLSIQLGLICAIMRTFTTSRILSHESLNSIERDPHKWKSYFSIDFLIGTMLSPLIDTTFFKKATTPVSDQDIKIIIELMVESKILFKYPAPGSTISSRPNLSSEGNLNAVISKLSELSLDKMDFSKGISSLLDTFIDSSAEVEALLQWPTFD